MSNRTLYDIITDAQDGNRPEYDDVLYALLALDALSTLDAATIRKLAFEKPSQAICGMYAEESFQRMKRALDVPPRQWLGWGHDPANPEHQRERQIALRLFKRFSG